jgi:hypothetical protein
MDRAVEDLLLRPLYRAARDRAAQGPFWIRCGECSLRRQTPDDAALDSTMRGRVLCSCRWRRLILVLRLKPARSCLLRTLLTSVYLSTVCSPPVVVCG